MDELKVEVKNHVGILTLNRPEKLNALTKTMGDVGVEALKDWATNPDVGAVIVTGAGHGIGRASWGDLRCARTGTQQADRYGRAVKAPRQQDARSWDRASCYR